MPDASPPGVLSRDALVRMRTDTAIALDTLAREASLGDPTDPDGAPVPSVLGSAQAAPAFEIAIRDAASGLDAVLVLDDVTPGIAAGGIRTARYENAAEAVQDAARLARAMTEKCALAGLPCGGGKLVVREEALIDRAAAFAVLGQRITQLGGLFRTAGDLGTTSTDLAIAAAHCAYVHEDEGRLAHAVAHSTLVTMQAALEAGGLGGIAGQTVGVQGAGDIGAAVTNALVAAGARVLVSDVDLERAKALVRAHPGRVQALTADGIWHAEMDVFCPAAKGGLLDVARASALETRLVCGPANNVLATPGTEAVLRARGIVFVPDVLVSAGAVIDGIGRTVMGLDEPAALIDALADTTWDVLSAARRTGVSATQIATHHAAARIAR